MGALMSDVVGDLACAPAWPTDSPTTCSGAFLPYAAGMTFALWGALISSAEFVIQPVALADT